MKNNELNQLIRNEIYTQSQVADVLNISPQMVSRLIKQNKLEPLNVIQGINLFSVESVHAYRRSKLGAQISETKPIYGGSTKKFIEDFNNLIEPGRVSAINLFFYDYDAILAGFYSTRGIPEKDKLMAIEAPSFVVTLDDFSEFYFSGALCGYGGEGPGGAYKVLTERLNVPPELAEVLFYSERLKLFREGDGWNASFDRRRDHEHGDKWEINYNMESRLYLFNTNLVAVRTRFGRYWIGMDYLGFLKSLSFFVEDPIELVVYSKEEAVSTGHYTYSSAEGVITYQLIIRDSSGKEVWLDTPVNDDYPLGNQTCIMDILEYLDIRYSSIENINGNLPDLVKNFLVSRIRVRKTGKAVFTSDKS